MAEITDELLALRDYVTSIGFTRINLAYLPEKYVAGELSIRYQGDDSTSETGYHYRLDRDYQFVVFGTSERDCLSKASALQKRMNGAHKIRVGESGWMSLGSFSMSQPFKAEDSDVYGIIGMLQATVREARDFSAFEVPSIGDVTVVVTPKPPGSEDLTPINPTKPDPEDDRGIPGVNIKPVIPADPPGEITPPGEDDFEISTGNGACK